MQMMQLFGGNIEIHTPSSCFSACKSLSSDQNFQVYRYKTDEPNITHVMNFLYQCIPKQFYDLTLLE